MADYKACNMLATYVGCRRGYGGKKFANLPVFSR
jgi:hypothetical protein